MLRQPPRRPSRPHRRPVSNRRVHSRLEEPIPYTVSFPAPHTHYVEVTATVPTARRASVELMMAVWTPGSYLVREYRAQRGGGDGRRRRMDARCAWRSPTRTAGASPPAARRRSRVKYRVYGREMSVRTNWIEAGFALLNGAPDVHDAGRPHVRARTRSSISSRAGVDDSR